ncbi:hypothetical protein KF707C_26840 [Metapseudomonas furukawaii]|uniref:Uncharacterized protein n=1 Tax=Metapseudomonas furukawaii TaxID=1149133 RepID=A0AAD1C068_METFU|nr:hypothetical protein KF707C_26840 [Pseudomonas furukawaii]
MFCPIPWTCGIPMAVPVDIVLWAVATTGIADTAVPPPTEPEFWAA